MYYYWAVVQQYSRKAPVTISGHKRSPTLQQRDAAALGIVDRHIHGEGVRDKNVALQIGRSYR